MSRPKLNLLIAYPYMSQRMLDGVAALGTDCRLLVDSGAFTAFRTGNPIDLAAYGTFLDTLPNKPWRYFNLDVIGDPDASERNYLTMRERGLRPLPIFTRGAPLDALDRMYETTDVVGIGGLVVARNRPHRYLKAVMRHVGGRKVHLLGFVDPLWLPYYRPYSCDASSFTRANRFGIIDVYLGDGRFRQVYRQKTVESPPSEAICRAIAGMGFDPYALAKWENWSKGYGIARWLSALSWVRYSIDLERQQNVLLFLAGSPSDLSLLQACYRAVVEGLNLEHVRREAMTLAKGKAA